MKCQGCMCDLADAHPNKRFCEECSEQRRLVQARESYQRNKPESRIGQRTSCLRCRQEIILDRPARKYCTECAPLRTKENRIAKFIDIRRRELQKRNGTPYTVSVSARLNDNVGRALKSLCDRYGISQSDVLRMSIEEFLGRISE